MTEKDIWVFAEKPGLLAELVSGARSLATQTGGQVAAFFLGKREQAEALQGADIIFWLGERKPNWMVEDYTSTLKAEMAAQSPNTLLVGATRRGRVIAGRLAAHFDTTVLTDVLEFTFEERMLQARHLIFGGGAVRMERALKAPIIATVGPGIFTDLIGNEDQAAKIVEVNLMLPEYHFVLHESKPRPPAAVDLSKAKRVVCAGRGIARKEDLEMVAELARLLNAELACTRPLAEGLDWLPLERYIGISGSTIQPDLYLGVGVSGQAQHIIGMSDSRLVVAINRDRNAPIYEQADYAIPDDLYKIVPALIEVLKEN